MENIPENKTEDKPKDMAKSKGFLQSFNTKAVLGVVILILLVVYAVYAKDPNNFNFKKLFSKGITKDEARAKIEALVKDSGGAATVKDVTEDGDLYRITVSANGQDQPVYVTKDGTKFIQQAITFEEIAKQQEAAKKQQEKANTPITKSDVPEVKLFVMSYCPFGTQMEKGILPVVATLGNKIKYTLEFVDYAMHGDKEIAENLRQFCIQKTQPAKLSAYLTCFLKKGEGTEASCMTSTGVNATQVKSCVAETDAQLGITKDAADKSKWSNGQFPPFNVNKDDNTKYGVQGSPTLVINGVEAQIASRDSASILKTICDGFNNPPKECQTKLSTTAPASGFGDGAAAAPAASGSTTGAGSCGS
jgi:hypothetical protein